MANVALKKHIGKHLQMARKAAGFKSARAFADHLGISKDTYTGYEQGRIAFSTEQAWNFAEALGCDINELVGFEPLERRSYEDPAQEALNAYYESMNDEGRERLVGIAELAADSSKVRVQKNAGTPGISTPMERSA